MIAKNKLKGGIMANRECSENQNKKKHFLEIGKKNKLTYVKYRDHILFRNYDPSKLKPCIRKTIGWISFEDKEAICICSDVPAKLILGMNNGESGLIILKSAVLERIDCNLTRILSTNHEDRLGNNALKRRKNKNAKADNC